MWENEARPESSGRGGRRGLLARRPPRLREPYADPALRSFLSVPARQVEMPDGEGELPQLKVKANRKGMNLGLSENMSRKAGWFCVPPPPHRVANKGWNRSCLVR